MLQGLFAQRVMHAMVVELLRLLHRHNRKGTPQTHSGAGGSSKDQAPMPHLRCEAYNLPGVGGASGVGGAWGGRCYRVLQQAGQGCALHIFHILHSDLPAVIASETSPPARRFIRPPIAT